MLPKVAVGLHCCASSTNVENYRALVGDDLVEEIQQFSRDLKDVRVCRVNATASGGGVAVLLGRQIPFYHALGIQTATPRGCAASFTAKRTGCAAGGVQHGWIHGGNTGDHRTFDWSRCWQGGQHGHMWDEMVSTGVCGRGTCLVARSMAQVIWVDEGNGNSCLLREVRST